MQYRKTLLINFCAALACCLIGLATAVPMPETPLAPGNHIASKYFFFRLCVAADFAIAADITVSVQIVQSVNGCQFPYTIFRRQRIEPLSILAADVSNTTSTSSTTSTSFIAGQHYFLERV